MTLLSILIDRTLLALAPMGWLRSLFDQHLSCAKLARRTLTSRGLQQRGEVLLN